MNITVPTDWDMYTDEADAALTKVVQSIAAMVDAGKIKNPTELHEMVVALVFASGEMDAEISDTEPRWNLTDWMETVCHAMQWDAGVIQRLGL